MRKYVVWFFVNGRDGMRITKALGRDAAEAVRAAIGTMPETPVVMIGVKEDR